MIFKLQLCLELESHPFLFDASSVPHLRFQDHLLLRNALFLHQIAHFHWYMTLILTQLFYSTFNLQPPVHCYVVTISRTECRLNHSLQQHPIQIAAKLPFLAHHHQHQQKITAYKAILLIHLN
jgi:hypothetical protein